MATNKITRSQLAKRVVEATGYSSSQVNKVLRGERQNQPSAKEIISTARRFKRGFQPGSTF